MSINPLTFGSPVYTPAFAVSPGDTGVMKLRSRESSPLTHESIDENFTNLANKINEILGLNVDELTISTSGIISASNLEISAGTGIGLTTGGEISHQAREAPVTGWSAADKDHATLQFISGLDFDSLGHVVGRKVGTLSFATTGHIGVSNLENAVTINSTAYGSGDSPSFGGITTTGNVGIGATNPQQPLEVSGSWGSQLRISRDTNQSQYSEISGGASHMKFKSVSNTHSVFNFVSDVGDGEVERMRIDSAGNVGIGTATPSASLEVVQPTVNKYALKANRADGTRLAGIYQDSNSNGTIGAYNASDTAKVWLNTNGASYFLGGNVGIGTASPTFKLDVASTTSMVLGGSDDELGITNGFNKSSRVGGISYTNANRPVNMMMHVSSSSADELCIGWGTGSMNCPTKITFGTAASVNTASNNAVNKRMTIDSEGKVGIGTTSPQEPLHVNGNFRVDGNLIFSPSGNTSYLVGGHVSTEFRNNANNSSLLTVKNDGNVGIGTTTPGAKLHIRNTLFGDTGIAIENTNNAQNLDIDFYSNVGAAQGRIRYQEGSGSFEINPNVSGDTPFTITNDGKVGIGTTSLGGGRRLTVAGGAIAVSGQNTSHSASSMVLGQDSTAISQIRFYGADTSTAGVLQFTGSSSDSSVGAERMRIDSSGNVGIGTANPNTSLHVTSPAGNGDGTVFIENTLETYGMGLKVKGGGNVDNERFALSVQNAAGDDILFAQSKTGNVGIGTASPQARLNIVQTALEPTLELQYNSLEGGFYKHLGCVSLETFSTSRPFLHVRIRTVWNDEGMFKIRAKGYLPYATLMDSSVGMYRYGSNPYRNYPYGVHYLNNGNQTSYNGGIASVYNTTEDPGYLVLVVYWPTPYTGFTLEYFGGGGTNGYRTQHDIQIIDFQRTDSSNPTTWS